MTNTPKIKITSLINLTERLAKNNLLNLKTIRFSLNRLDRIAIEMKIVIVHMKNSFLIVKLMSPIFF